MGSTFNSLVGLIILALDIWAILNVIKSGSEVGVKVLWILLIALLPVVGLVIWQLPGRGGTCASERLCRPFRRLARSHRYCAALKSCGAPVGAGKPAKRPAQTKAATSQ